jgi:hypothetical protein
MGVTSSGSVRSGVAQDVQGFGMHGDDGRMAVRPTWCSPF